MKQVFIEKNISKCVDCPHYHYGPADDDPGISSCDKTRKKKWHSESAIFQAQSTAKDWNVNYIPSWCPLPDSKK